MDTNKMTGMIQAVCEDLISRKDEFCELDAKAGDGDLGVTLVYGCRAILEYLEEYDLDVMTPGEILEGCGEAFEENTGSTLSIIIAEMLYAAAKSLGESEDLGKALLAAVDGVAKRGKVTIGDKTIYDSLKPSADAYMLQQNLGVDVAACLEHAVEAATAGMESTRGMKARTGRASWMGDGVVEHVDAGSVVWVRILTKIQDLVIQD